MRSVLPAGLALLLALSLVACGDSRAATVGGDPAWGWVTQPVPTTLGVTHAQYSLAPSDPAEARARGEAILAESGPLQVQHIMGFGALNPEPSPGVEDWSSLDRRMQLVRDTGGQAVLTLAVAPDWMKGGAPGSTDWSRIEEAPLPEHYGDFADLAARAVARYPEVDTVMVWNELKGFFDDETNRWDAEGYTALYNQVYRAVRAVRPDIAVGGPYVVLDAYARADAGGTPSPVRGPWGVADQRSLDVVEYWLAHHDGADFLVVDGGTATRDAGLITTPSQGVERFAALTSWLRERTELPVWWSEFYAESGPAGTGSADPATEAASPRSAAATLDAVAAFARSGVSTALLWQPQAADSLPYAALWTDTEDPDGGRPTALTAAWTWLVPRLGEGGVALGRSPDGRVLGFRADDGLLVVNTTGEPATVVDDLVLGPWASTILE